MSKIALVDDDRNILTSVATGESHLSFDSLVELDS